MAKREIIYCKYCNENKTKDNFTSSQMKNKFQKCKQCVKVYNDLYYQQNMEKLRKQATERYEIDSTRSIEYSKNYRKNNPDKISSYRKDYYKNNKEKEKETNLLYRENNKQFIYDKQKEWREENDKYKLYQKNYSVQYREENKDSLRFKKLEWERKKVKNDPIFKLKKTISRAVNRGLFANKTSKFGNSCWNYLEYTVDELKAHLESQFEPWMNWNNRGTFNSKIWNDDDSSTWTWQIDHIVPQSIFKYASMADDNFKKCWALENLRPLSAKQNVLDGVNRIRHK